MKGLTIKNKTNYKLVIIEWKDSALGFQGWKFIDEQTYKLPIVTSIGFLIKDTKEYKVLFPHLHNSNNDESISGSGDILIPTSSIIKIKELSI